MSIRILIADDRTIVRQGLTALVEKEDGMQVVGQAADGRTALRLASKLSPDVVIMDVTMPDLNGIDAARQITAHNPRVKVLALSVHSDRRFIAEMLTAGASGYVLKDCAFDELVRAIRSVVANRMYLSPAIADIVIEDYTAHLAENGASGRPISPLTPREREVLQLLAEGNSTKEIACHLQVSVKTVETHRQNIMQKLDIRSVAGLTKYAIREGLTHLDV